MNLSYDGKRFEATPEFIQAVKDLMKAEIEMMRGVDDNPLNWSVGIAKIDDLEGTNYLSMIFGSAQDFGKFSIGPKEIVYVHPREEMDIKFEEPAPPNVVPPSVVFEADPMTTDAVISCCAAGVPFYQVTQMNIVECRPICFVNSRSVSGEPFMWLADNTVGRIYDRIGTATVAPNTYFATKEAAVAQLRKNIIGFVEALNDGVLKDTPVNLINVGPDDIASVLEKAAKIIRGTNEHLV